VAVATYRVLYADVDQMGVMYYANYFKLFERGRAECIRGLGVSYRRIEEGGVILPVTEAHCHYHGSARYDDLLHIETHLARVRRASVRFEYLVFRDDSRAERLAEGYTVHACFSASDRRVIRLPDWLKGILMQGD
jgi:acyl-CoA thioester hydrolase